MVPKRIPNKDDQARKTSGESRWGAKEKGKQQLTTTKPLKYS